MRYWFMYLCHASLESPQNCAGTGLLINIYSNRKLSLSSPQQKYRINKQNTPTRLNSTAHMLDMMVHHCGHENAVDSLFCSTIEVMLGFVTAKMLLIVSGVSWRCPPITKTMEEDILEYRQHTKTQK
jgi:hypothetical protein